MFFIFIFVFVFISIFMSTSIFIFIFIIRVPRLEGDATTGLPVSNPQLLSETSQTLARHLTQGPSGRCVVGCKCKPAFAPKSLKQVLTYFRPQSRYTEGTLGPKSGTAYIGPLGPKVGTIDRLGSEVIISNRFPGPATKTSELRRPRAGAEGRTTSAARSA